MKNSFIDEYSWKCLLGPMSKNPNIVGNLATWTVNKKKHFTILNTLQECDIDFLKNYKPCNFHYLDDENLSILKNNFDVQRSRYNSTAIDLEKLHYNGRTNHGIRHAINSCKKINLTIQDNFNHINDVKDMIEIWSNDYTSKYFRDYSGKNSYFLLNNFHNDCINTFIYYENKLVAFSVLSNKETSSYIIGKALFKGISINNKFIKLNGLTEYLDDLSYQKAKSNGVKIVNLGQSLKNIAKYKNKFNSSFTIHNYDGNIK